MPKLTKLQIDVMTFQGKTPKHRDIRWCESIPGFGVRVWPSGKKSFVVWYRINGRQRSYSIGRYGPLTIQQARDIAHRKLAQVIEGKDPLAERQRLAVGKTFADLAETYIERHAKPKKKTWKEDQQRLNDHVLPFWGSRQVATIKRSDVAQLHQRIGKVFPGAANRTLQMLSKMFNCAIAWGYLEDNAANPCKGVERFPEHSRDRFVSHQEMPKLASSINGEPNVFIRSLIWLYLLTAARKKELMKIKWTQVNLVTGEIRIGNTKNGKPHYVPLSKPALTILHALPRIAGNEYVFCGRDEGKPLDNIDKAWRRIRKEAGLEDVWLHDLRRTVGSWVAQSGGSLVLVGNMLNQDSVRASAIYARFSRDPVRKAFDQHGSAVAEFISLKPNPKPEEQKKAKRKVTVG